MRQGMMALQLDIIKYSLLTILMTSWVFGELLISPDSHYCSQYPTFLSCDFLGTQELVVLESLPKRDQAVETVYIHNAEEMLIGGDICLSLVAFNITNITYSSVPNACRDRHFSVKLVDSHASRVPHYISHLDMQRSSANEVTIDRNLRLFSIVNSVIGNLKVSKPVIAQKLKVEHTVIENVENIHLESKSQLLLYNVTVNRMAKSSVHLTESVLSIWGGSIKAMDEAITLGPRASLVLKDTDGKISVTGVQMPTTPPPPPEQIYVPPGVPPPKQGSPPCNHSALWVLPTILAAVEGIVIIINCSNWFPSLKGKRIRRSLEEGGDGMGRPTEVNSFSPTWYRNTECFPTPVNRRQTREYNKYM